MDGREGRGVVTLDGRGEGLAWMQLGLWFLLAAAAASAVLSFHALHIVQSSSVRELEFMLVPNRAVGLVSSAVQLVGAIALLVGVSLARRLARDDAAVVLLGLSAAGLLLMVAAQLFGLALTTELDRLDTDSALLDLMRWSWLVHAAARPIACVSLLLALRRAAVGGRTGDGVLAVVALVSVAQAVLLIAVFTGAQIELGIGRYGLLLDFALEACVLGGALVAVRRARGGAAPAAVTGPPADGAALSGGAGWERAASGLDIFAGALIARAVIGLVGPLGLLLDAAGYAGDAMSAAYLVALVGNLGCAVAMAAGINRVRAAPEPATARVNSGAAALLMLFCFLIDAQFLLVLVRLMAESGPYGGGGEVQLVGAMADSGIALVAWLALLRAISSLGRPFGDGSGARGAPAIAVALVIVVIASALFDRRALMGDWPLGPEMWLPLLGAFATLIVAARFAGLARRLGARIRSAAGSAPPLARAVARERDGNG